MIPNDFWRNLKLSWAPALAACLLLALEINPGLISQLPVLLLSNCRMYRFCPVFRKAIYGCYTQVREIIFLCTAHQLGGWVRFLRPSPPCGKSVLTSRLKSCAAKVGDLPPFSPSPNGSANLTSLEGFWLREKTWKQRGSLSELDQFAQTARFFSWQHFSTQRGVVKISLQAAMSFMLRHNLYYPKKKKKR